MEEEYEEGSGLDPRESYDDMNAYKNDEAGDDMVNDLIGNLNNAQQMNSNLSQALSGSHPSKDINFLHHQLSTDHMLEKLEHFYRGDYEGLDESGNKVWKKQKDKNMITFNEYGVTSLMEILTKYIDKGTILSNYLEERIYEIMGDIGDELILFILSNYEMLGMNTYFKKTKFRIIVVTTLHIIESTYRRAKNGETMKELNQAKVVSQFSGQEPPRYQQPYNKRPSLLSRISGMH